MAAESRTNSLLQYIFSFTDWQRTMLHSVACAGLCAYLYRWFLPASYSFGLELLEAWLMGLSTTY